MDQIIGKQILFFLSALGGFNGLLVSGYYFFNRHSQLKDKFLAALILMISIRVLKSVFYFFYPDIGKTILQIGLSACLMIGPFVYLYSLSVTDQLEKSILNWKQHLILIAGTTVVVGLIYPYESHASLWGDVFYKAINYIWLIYLLVTGLVWKAYLPSKKVLRENWFPLSVYIGTALIWLAFFTSSFTSYIVGALSFSFVFYLCIALVIRQKRIKETKKYQGKKVDENKADAIIAAFHDLMVNERLYIDPDLSLSDVASKLLVSKHLLSQILNDNLGQSFTWHVNYYRIELAKQKLIDARPSNMEDMAYECGFNSKSTFYSAFKKMTEMTPAQYKKSV